MKRALNILILFLFTTLVAFAGDVPKLGQNYPNPAKEKTYVKVEFSSAVAVLTVSDILGRKIQVHSLNNSGTFILDMTNVPEGVYFYTLDSDGQKVTKKLTVKK